jgi:tetratricopeptide (TPR) repeat protein
VKKMSFWEERNKCYQQGWALLDIGRPAEAIPLFLKALEMAPEDTYALCSLSSAHYRRKEYETGLDYANRAVLSDPEEEWSHRCRSYCLEELNRKEDALEAAQEAVRLAPEGTYSLHQLAHILLVCGRLQEAEATAEELRELAPDEASTYISLGQIYRHQNRLPEAEACERKALEIDPNSSMALNNLGATLGRGGRQQEAIDLYEEALRADPTNALARYNLEREVQAYGFVSVQEYLHARHNPARMSLARQFRRLKEQAEKRLEHNRIAEAKALLLEAQRLIPNNLKLLDLLARAEWSSLPKALRVAEKMIQTAPEASIGYWRRGTVLMAMREGEIFRRFALARDALRDAQEAVRLAPEDGGNLLLLAEAQCACDQWEEAEQTAKKLVKLHPDWSWGCKLLGDIYRQQKHLRIAESFYQKGLQLANDDADAINNIGLALWEMGKREDARNCFDRAHELCPDDPHFRFNRYRTAPWKLFKW